MSKTAKAITAGALVAAVSGVLAIAEPFGQPGGVAMAVTDTGAVPATWVTGDIMPASSCTRPTSEVDGVVRHMWGYACGPQTWTTSDPRLTGEATQMWNVDVYEPDADAYEDDAASNISVLTGAYDVRNEAGGWACRSHGLARGYGLLPEYEPGETSICLGRGEYDGLSAILVSDARSGRRSFVGLIFPGDAPPLPVPPAEE